MLLVLVSYIRRTSIIHSSPKQDAPLLLKVALVYIYVVLESVDRHRSFRRELNKVQPAVPTGTNSAALIILDVLKNLRNKGTRYKVQNTSLRYKCPCYNV